MSLWLDSANLKEIEFWRASGVINGVTTNPVIFERTSRGASVHEVAITSLGCNLALEVTTEDRDEMIEQAEELNSLRDNIVIKIPIHSSNYRSNLDVIHHLNESNIRVLATCCMSAQQALMAGLAGASWVALFCGRIADMGHDPVQEIERASSVLGIEMRCSLMAASVREPQNVVDWLNAGADAVTVQAGILRKMIMHPRTKETVDDFMKASERNG